MVITESVIKATAAAYTREELVAKQKEAIQKLAEQEYISSASTGAGASYSISQRAQCEELVELFSAAIQYIDTGIIGGTGAAVFRPVFFEL